MSSCVTSLQTELGTLLDGLTPGETTLAVVPARGVQTGARFSMMERRAMFGPTRGRSRVWLGSPGSRWKDVALSAAMIAGMAVIFLGAAMGAELLPLAPLLPLALIVGGIAAWVMLRAIAGSRVAIILYFAVVAFVTDAQFRVRGAGEVSGDWQSALKFLIWLGAGVIGCSHMPPLRTMLRQPASACLLASIVVAITSSVYSPIPAYSFGCALALFCLFAFSYTLTTYLTESQLLWTLLLTLTVFNIAGWFIFYLVPDLGTSAAWTTSGITMRMCGLAGQATNLGAVCAKAVGAAFILWYTRKAGWVSAVVLGGFAVVTLLKSDARTSEIAAFLGLGIVVASRSSWLVAGLTLSAVSGLLLLTFPNMVKLLGDSVSRSGDPTEVYTLTGRLEIWEYSWQQIKLSPMLGYGYNSSKVILGAHIGFENGLLVDTAHNLYLQILLSVGLLGMIPIALLLVHLTIRCFVRPIPIVCYVLILVLVSSISDTDTIGATPTLMTLVFFVVSLWPGLEGKVPANSARSRFGPAGAAILRLAPRSPR